MTTVCTPLTADGTTYTADSSAIRADMTEVCITVADPVPTTTGGSGVIKPQRKRARLPTSWDGTKAEPAVAAPVENEEALLLLL